MKSHFVLIITLFYLFGTAGIPVVAYCCIDSGEVGVATYLSGPPGSCYVDSCCHGDDEASSVRIQSDTGCCQLDSQGVPESNRMLSPAPKYGSGELTPKTLSRVDASLPDICVVSEPPTDSPFHAPINLPLII